MENNIEKEDISKNSRGYGCMKLIEILVPDFENNDCRGSLIQLVRRGYSQVNVVESKAGVYRGGHFHKLNTEAYYVIEGKCKVSASRDDMTETKVFSKGDFFRMAPCVSHGFEYMDDTIMVTMYSLGVELENGEKDIYEGICE